MQTISRSQLFPPCEFSHARARLRALTLLADAMGTAMDYCVEAGAVAKNQQECESLHQLECTLSNFLTMLFEEVSDAAA